MITGDYGSQEHVFTSLQAYINQKVDKFFSVTDDELYGVPKAGQAPSKPIFSISMRRIDIKKDDKW